MNFIYGIPGIQIVGAYLSGCPFIYKGHPFAAVTNTTLAKMLLAAGADPSFFQKVEGFGGGIASRRHRRPRRGGLRHRLRGDRPQDPAGHAACAASASRAAAATGPTSTTATRDEELGRIATRLTYAKLGFGSHKCTSSTASPRTRRRSAGSIR